MSDLPDAVKRSALFQRLSDNRQYLTTIESVRGIAEALARQIERIAPDFTDHSIRHMDALWLIAEAVLTEDEIRRCSAEEIFLLCCAFYVHDLGMAIPCTAEGMERLRSTAEYRAALRRATDEYPAEKKRQDEIAVRAAARTLHAEMAPALLIEPIPGLGRYLIEDSDMREKWGCLIGEVAASHHWDLQQLELRLGRRGIVPTADSGRADLGFVACVLRITDYAHINRDRALQLERLIRSEISQESSLHWDAQANITGPSRDHWQLVYGCTTAIASIDAWWLFYDMVSGLDTEIRMVRDYLDGRKVSAGRFSLQGVRGAESPESFSLFVNLNSEIVPIDIRVQPNSMERIIDLLGGPALYGGDRLAPVRELIQNCRDAIALRNALETIDHQELTPGRVEVSLDTTRQPALLRVRDNGVGMTRNIVKNHLIAVASDFWDSADYARDFGGAAKAGFMPIGRFGIGFLSVFMFGDYVEVETERIGSPRVLLRLRGVGRRGELAEKLPTGRPGTEVRIALSDSIAQSLAALAEVVKARAPMMPFEIRTEVISTEGAKSTAILPQWWTKASSSELNGFLSEWDSIARTGKSSAESGTHVSRRLLYLRLKHGQPSQQREKSEWPGEKPDFSDASGRLIDGGGEPGRGVLQCSHGVAVDIQPCRGGVFGLVEVGEVALTPDRSSANSQEAYSRAMQLLMEGLAPRVRAAVDGLERFGSIPARQAFLRDVAELYGADLLATSSLRWIPTLEQPGNLIHRSVSELKSRLETQQAVVICSGVSPAKAYSLATQRLSPPELNQCLQVLLPENEFKKDYELEKRLEVEEGSTRLRGPLQNVVSRVGSEMEEFLLLGILLDLVAVAWSITREALEEQQWELDVAYLTGYLWGLLRRP